MRELIAFEWRYHTRQASFYAAILLFAFIAGALIATGFGPQSLPVNSPFLVMESLGFVSLLSIFAVAVFAANAALRDQEHRMQEIVYCTPIGRFEFLLGRFAGAFLATLTAMAVSIPVLILGTYLPWQDPERIAAFEPIRYLWAFGALTIPNVLLAASVLFAVAFLTRSALWTYAAAVFLYFAYFAVSALTNSPIMAQSTPGASTSAAVAIFDPFGFSAFFEITRHWPIAAKSTRLVPLAGWFLYNRLFCVAGAMVVLGAVYRLFSFRTTRLSSRSVARDLGGSAAPVSSHPRPQVPRYARDDNQIAAYRSAAKFELRIFRSKPVLLLLLLWLGLAASEIWSEISSGEYGRVLHPATGVIVETLRTPLSLVGMILIIYYGAEMFWREQRDRMAAVIDTTPVTGAVMIAAKMTAMASLIAAVIFAGILPGVALQIAQGQDLQLLVYLSLFYFSGLPLLLLGALALLVHSLSPGKYAGMIAALIVILLANRASMIGLDHPLWRFAGAPPVRYTDLNGFGHDAGPFNSLMLHWSVMALLFVMIAAALWRRIGHPIQDRLRTLVRHQRRAHAAVLLVLILLTGSWIYYNTDVLNARTTTDELFDWRADYEKTYKKFASWPQPRVKAVNVDVDLYPGERRYHVAGEYALFNDTNAPIRTVFVAIRRNAVRASASMPDARVSIDRKFGIHRFELVTPLAPSARTTLKFDLDFANRGIPEDPDDSIVENGTYLMSLRCMPTLGYRIGYQLRGERERRERGLSGSGESILAEEGPEANEQELDRVDLTATVSTVRDQTAITAGRLEKSWEQNGRRYFRYKTTAPIFNMMAFASGRYEIAKRRHNNIDVEIYYHPTHRMNVELMLDSAVATIDYCEKNFSPYPGRQLRIIELPSYWDFGGYALPETVFLVEDRSFLFDTNGSANGPDLVIRRVAHEVAHQWWGHTVMPATTEGASMIVESLTKYTEVMVLERMRGRESVRRLLDLELERYLTGRSREETSEPPLYKVRNQAYLYYAKGSIVLCAIRDQIGEERLNAALRDLVREYAQHGGRATSLDLWKRLPRHPLIDEWMKDITLYDFKVESANAVRRADGRYDVTVRVAAAKSRADARGEETAMPLAESIDIGLYADEAPLLVAKRELRTGANMVTFIVDREPSYVAIDPYVTRIDQSPGDNTFGVR